MTEQTKKSPSDDDIIDLSELIKAVRTRLPLCGAIVGGVTVLALAYSFLATPVYLSSTRMLIEPGNLKVTQIQDVYDSDVGRDSTARKTFMQTQIRLLTSDKLLAKVFEHFRLAEDPDYADSKQPLLALSKQVVIKEVPNTSLVDIGFKDKDARKAAEIANYLARVYMDDSRQRASGFSNLGLERLQDELLTMAENRRKAVRQLNDYKLEHNILSVDAAQKLGIERLTALDEVYVSAQEALASAKATVDAIELWRKSGKRLDSIPEAISNPTLTQFKMARLNAQSALIKTLQDFGSGHRSVAIQRKMIEDMDRAIADETENALISVQAKYEQAKTRVQIIEKMIEDMDRAIADETENALISVQAKYEQAKTRVQIIEAERKKATDELKALDAIADEYRMLDDNLKAAEEAYKFVLQRVNELQIARNADSGAGGTFQVIDVATPPVRAAFPQKGKIVSVAFLGSAVLSVLLCILLELMDKTVKRREEVEQLADAPVYGMIPFAGDGDRTDVVTYDKSQSMVAEAFRGLRTALSLSTLGRMARVLAVTSSVSGDGKTFVSLNTAITYARAKKRVLLVDSDLRRQRLTNVVSKLKPCSTGMSNLLAGDIALSDFAQVLVKPFDDMTLDVMTSGPETPTPVELLSGENLRKLLDILKEHYDMIIFDAPPVLSVADTRALAALEELNFLVVVRMNSTEKKQLAMTVDSLRGVNARFIGTVMNHSDAESEQNGYSYGYGYGYGYGQHQEDAPKADGKMSRLNALLSKIGIKLK